VSPSVFQRAAATTNKAEKINKGLIPKRAPGDNQDAFDVLEDGVMVGRIFLVSDGPPNTLWMWASGHNRDISRAAHGYEDCDGSVRQVLAAAALVAVGKASKLTALANDLPYRYEGT
jgi:hypothetical protein